MKTAFITGASHGIGQALAQKFLKEGFSVVATSPTGTVEYSDPNLKILPLDLLKDESIRECAEVAAKLGMKIDILVNNAGVLLDIGEEDIDIEKLRKTLQVNLIGTVDLTQRLLPFMNDGGHVVNISSSAGSLTDVHHTGYPAYKISKAALNMFTSYLAFRLKGKITVSSIHPGRVKTGLGNWEGEMEPEEAAGYIYATATKPGLESGQFWYKGEKFPW